jgi:hypothetical protein
MRHEKGDVLTHARRHIRVENAERTGRDYQASQDEQSRELPEQFVCVAQSVS